MTDCIAPFLPGAHRSPGDTGVTLDVDVEERRTVVFEPGVTKTLFDSNWAGEVWGLWSII